MLQKKRAYQNITVKQIIFSCNIPSFNFSLQQLIIICNAFSFSIIPPISYPEEETIHVINRMVIKSPATNNASRVGIICNG